MGVMNERDPLEDSDPRFAGGKRDRPTSEEPGGQSVDDMILGELSGYGVLPGEAMPGMEEPVFGEPPDDKAVLRFISQAEPKANEFFQDKAMDKVLAVYRAARNEHPLKSKYFSPLYKNRSAYHRPKTRNAIKRVQTAAANALFAARDVIDISPGDESNPVHRAAAAMRKELVNYRLSRSSGRNAIPWFEIAVGGRTDAYCTGYTISLQTWQYRRRKTGTEPMRDEMGREIMTAGGPVMKDVHEILADRPDITLYPIENVGIDPAAPWQDPAQGAAFIYLKDPVYSNDLKAVMTQGGNRSNIPWRDPESISWSDGRVDPNQDSRSVRTGRGDGGTDRMEDLAGTQEYEDGNTLVWRYLWFFRWEGEDYCVYTLGTRTLLSDPIPTAEAFPHLSGQRPVVIGTDVIAPHDLMPTSNASALQPMQQEINEQTNLRIDAIKQSVYPLAKVKRGRNVDITSLSRRGPSSNILVEDTDDVTYETIPNGAAPLFQEMDRLNNDFDESAGIFSNSSVQGQRAMNETVGGMKILAGDAQAVANLELRVWTETWVERVISQIVLLEAYYETDERILSICGQRADLEGKFGVSVINDDLLLAEVQTLVDVGTGAADPNESIGRFKMAFDTVMPLIGAEVQAGRASLNVKEIVNEVFGHAGYKDAGDRFITVNEEGTPTQDQLNQLQAQLDEANARLQELEIGRQAEKDITKAKLDTDLAKQEADQRHEKEMLFLQAKIDQISTLLGGVMGAQADQRKAQFAEAADERKANTAMEADKRKLTMTERQTRATDQRAAQDRLFQLQQQAMTAPPARPSPTEQLAAPPPAAAGPQPGASGPQPGMEGAPPEGMPPEMGGLPAEIPIPPEGIPPAESTPPPDMGADLTSPVVDIVQQALAGMAQQLILPMQQMMMEVAQTQAAQQAQIDIVLRAMTAPQKIERGPDGRVAGARRDLSGIDLSSLPGPQREQMERMMAALSSPAVAERGEDGRVTGTRRDMN
jgi:hypothetical protein